MLLNIALSRMIVGHVSYEGLGTLRHVTWNTTPGARIFLLSKDLANALISPENLNSQLWFAENSRKLGPVSTPPA